MVAWRWWLRWTASLFAVGSREADDGRRSARMTAAHLRRRARLVMALRSRAQVQVSMYPPLPVELPALGTTYPLHPLMLMPVPTRNPSRCPLLLLCCMDVFLALLLLVPPCSWASPLGLSALAGGRYRPWSFTSGRFVIVPCPQQPWRKERRKVGMQGRGDSYGRNAVQRREANWQSRVWCSTNPRVAM